MKPKYKPLFEAIQAGDGDIAIAQAACLIENNVPPVQVFSDYLEPYLKEVGEPFPRLKIFLPDKKRSN